MDFQNSLYGKFFREIPPFDQVKMILQDKWSDFGVVYIPDLPISFLIIYCNTYKVMEKILFDGPWALTESFSS